MYFDAAERLEGTPWKIASAQISKLDFASAQISKLDFVSLK